MTRLITFDMVSFHLVSFRAASWAEVEACWFRLWCIILLASRLSEEAEVLEADADIDTVLLLGGRLL